MPKVSTKLDSLNADPLRGVNNKVTPRSLAIAIWPCIGSSRGGFHVGLASSRLTGTTKARGVVSLRIWAFHLQKPVRLIR